MRNNMIIRITENDVNNMIAEAATRMINELDQKTYAMAAKKALDRSYGEEDAGKASKAVVRKVVKELAQDEEFLNMSMEDKLDAIKWELEDYYRNMAYNLGAEANDGQDASIGRIDKMAERILRDYFYDNDEGKWKSKDDMPDIGVDYSSFYDN